MHSLLKWFKALLTPSPWILIMFSLQSSHHCASLHLKSLSHSAAVPNFFLFCPLFSTGCYIIITYHRFIPSFLDIYLSNFFITFRILFCFINCWGLRCYLLLEIIKISQKLYLLPKIIILQQHNFCHNYLRGLNKVLYHMLGISKQWTIVQMSNPCALLAIPALSIHLIHPATTWELLVTPIHVLFCIFMSESKVMKKHISKFFCFYQ